MVLKWLKKGDTVLDLCCGFGRVSIPLARKGYNVKGVDLSPGMIRWARAEAKRLRVPVKFLSGSMTRLPVPSSSMDVIVCLWSSFSHLLTVRDQLKALNEMYRVLSEGGMAFMDMPDGEIRRTVEALKRHGHGQNKRVLSPVVQKVRTHIYIHDRGSLSHVISKSDFEDYRVGFKVMGGVRKLVAYLWK
jgi:ubiquinone/menaquinone biosynthesis C-methylase UbiE